jgi:hypothetical protein
VDVNGNLYVADEFNDIIRKIAPVETNWVVSTLAGQIDVTGSNPSSFEAECRRDYC